MAVKSLPKSNNNESSGRERSLEPKEEERLLAASSEPLRTILMWGISAGLHIPSEVLSLKWKDVDPQCQSLTVQGALSDSASSNRGR
ncbi:MAG: hypothetical protein DMG08_08240 [Acidobacteria bacterium]|nr:MAG: hypothetical protein DMG08_08240 [Acidobacteriota bacterium]